MMNSSTGQRIALAAHISQSIADILTTPIGSRLMRRAYGSFIPQLIDQPLTQANVLRLQAATAQAVMQWEPRTRLRRVTLAFGSDGRAVLTLQRQDIGQTGNQQQTLSLN